MVSARAEAPDALDDYPTPPWATRALIVHAFKELGLGIERASVWEPAAGRGIMSGVLREFGARVFASDVHAYPDQRTPIDAIGSFVAEEGLDQIRAPAKFTHPHGLFDYVITNHPFRLGVEFFERAITEANHVALLARTNWMEGTGRYASIFRPRPPIAVAQFVERVPMLRGRFDPDATTLTSYAWFIWSRAAMANGQTGTRLMWIPPCRVALTKPDDRKLYANMPPAPLLEEGATA